MVIYDYVQPTKRRNPKKVKIMKLNTFTKALRNYHNWNRQVDSLEVQEYLDISYYEFRETLSHYIEKYDVHGSNSNNPHWGITIEDMLISNPNEIRRRKIASQKAKLAWGIK